MLVRIDHLDLAVRDVDGMAQLLAKLGFQEIRRTEHHGLAVEMRLPGEGQVVLELHSCASDAESGVNHIAFLVDDCESSFNELTSLGVAFENPVKHIPSSGRTVCTIAGTPGIRLQLAQ